VLLAAAVVAEALMPLGMILAGGALVGEVPDAVEDGFDSAAGRRLIGALTAVVTLLLLSQVVSQARGLIVDVIGRRLDGVIQSRLMRATLRPTGIGHLESPALQDQLSVARGLATGRTPGAAVRGLADVVVARLQAIGSAALIGIWFNWWLAVGLFVVLLATRSRVRDSVWKTVEILQGTSPILRRADYYLGLALTPNAAKESRVFGLADWIVARFRGHWLDAMERAWAERRAAMRAIAPWVLVVGSLAVFAAFALAGDAAVDGRIGLAALAIVMQAIGWLTGTLFSFQGSELDLEFGAGSLPSLFALEAAMVETVPRALHDARDLPTREIRFDGVRFAYPDTPHDVFQGLDLVIPTGRSLAIVGANGAGKTTLIKLLTRLYDPAAGRILVDGIDLREIDPASWRRRVAVLFQDFVHYELPARDNVGFGALSRAADEGALDLAAHKASADGVIADLPHGWETVLSRAHRGGADLSGGQWQRIALARALLALEAGAPVLILDEPTASLDVRSEAAIFARLLELTRGRTTILISHRFSTVRMADAIVVLDNGRVVEQGTHDELMAIGGRYARLFTLQAARFTDESDAGEVEAEGSLP
jgi:ATP-binding cassette subfamily B protein